MYIFMYIHMYIYIYMCIYIYIYNISSRILRHRSLCRKRPKQCHLLVGIGQRASFICHTSKRHLSCVKETYFTRKETNTMLPPRRHRPTCVPP